MARNWAIAAAVGIGLCFGVAGYLLVLHYEVWAQTWHQGSIALGWGPFQLFYANVFPRPGLPPNLSMGMGYGVLIDPAVVAYLAYRVIGRRRPSSKV